MHFIKIRKPLAVFFLDVFIYTNGIWMDWSFGSFCSPALTTDNNPIKR
jgi:hypothetical protein